jgi:hypothetical protein
MVSQLQPIPIHGPEAICKLYASKMCNTTWLFELDQIHKDPPLCYCNPKEGHCSQNNSRTEANREQKQSFCLLHTRERWVNLQRNSLRRAVEQVSKPSKTWDATSGGTTGEGGPSIRSSPVRIVSSAIPAPYTSLLFSFLANFLLVKGFKTSSYGAATSTAIAYSIDTGSGTLKRVATETQILSVFCRSFRKYALLPSPSSP